MLDVVEDEDNRATYVHLVKKIADLFSNVAAEVGDGVVSPLHSVCYSASLKMEVMKAHIRGTDDGGSMRGFTERIWLWATALSR